MKKKIAASIFIAALATASWLFIWPHSDSSDGVAAPVADTVRPVPEPNVLLTRPFRDAVAYGFLCYGPKFRKIDSLKGLPPEVRKIIGRVADRGEKFNSTDVIDADSPPGSRFVIGAISKDLILVQEESGGIVSNVQVERYVRFGSDWKSATWAVVAMKPIESIDDFLAASQRASHCQLRHDAMPETDEEFISGVTHASTQDPRAQFALAHFYATGFGVVKDIDKAQKLYRQSVLTEADLQYCLGYLYLNGEDVPKDFRLARHYFQLAAVNESKNAMAMNNIDEDSWEQLAMIFDEGKGLKANRVVSYALYNMIKSEWDYDMYVKQEKVKSLFTTEELQSADDLIRQLTLANKSKKSVGVILDEFLSPKPGRKSLPKPQTGKLSDPSPAQQSA